MNTPTLNLSFFEFKMDEMTVYVATNLSYLTPRFHCDRASLLCRFARHSEHGPLGRPSGRDINKL